MTESLPIQPTQQQYFDEDEIDLRQYLHVLFKYKWSILGLSFVCTLLTIVVVFSMQPIYEATATLLIESQEQKVVSIEEVYGLPGAKDDYFETQNQLLQSRELAERVIDKLKLVTHPEYDPTIERTGFSLNPMQWLPKDWFPENKSVSDSVQSQRNSIVGHFRGNLSVSPVRNSQLINISFESNDPGLSAAVPNALAEAYIDSNLEGRLAMTQRAAGWITERLDGLRQKVKASEQALQGFRDKEKLVDVKGVDSLAAKELDEITGGLVEVRRNLSEAEELYRQVNALKGQPIRVFASIPAVLEDKNVQQAKEVQAKAQRKVSEMAKRYGPKHPKMISAVSDFDNADESLTRQIQNVVNSVGKRFEIARAKERQLSKALNSTKGEMAQINRVTHNLRALERDVESNRQLYDMFLTRNKETSATGGIQPDNARVVDPAVVPSHPIKPKKKLIVLIAMFLSGMIGAMLAFLIESLDNTIKDSADLENRLGIPVLGLLPMLDTKKSEALKTLHYYSEHTETGFSENIRTIRTGMLLSSIDEKNKVILVTSSIPSEGKSVLSVNLALALGQLGKVLLIDGDLRRPSIGQVFNLKSELGLSQFIVGSEPLDSCMHYFKEDNLYVMPAGVIPPNPLELISSERFKKGLSAIKLQFDYVVIDSAPTIAVSDSLVLSRHATGVIYVVKADNTPYQLAVDGVKRLQHTDSPIVGAVLNQVTPSKKTGRYGQYNGDYYKYYGYQES